MIKSKLRVKEKMMNLSVLRENIYKRRVIKIDFFSLCTSEQLVAKIRCRLFLFLHFGISPFTHAYLSKKTTTKYHLFRALHFLFIWVVWLYIDCDVIIAYFPV